MPDTDEKLEISKRLELIEGGFELLRIIGRGTLGTVCECRRASDGEIIAVKLMRLTPMGSSGVFEGIINAALATKPLAEHANVVPVFSAGGIPPDAYYITMRMMKGGTLEEHLARAPLSLPEKLEMSAKIADALHAIHFKGIIHGDLKPSNILMSAEGEPYLNDFYLYSSTISAPVPYMSIGTPFYMSPEQASGALVTPKTDIYSFGVMLYELLTGKTPYPKAANSISGLIEEISNGAIPPPSTRTSGLSAEIDAVVLKLLRKDPEDRYADMSVAAADLRACACGSGISIPVERKSFWRKLFR